MNADNKSLRRDWRWWFVGLAGLMLIAQVVFGLRSGWELYRTVNVVVALAIGLSFLLQIRESRRKRLSDDHREKGG